MKLFKRIFFLGLAISTLVVIYGLVQSNINKSELKSFDLELEHFGVIDEIKIDTMTRGTPKFLIHGEWIYLGSFGRSIRFIVIRSDSISKVRGNNYLELYRKNSVGYSLFQKVEAW